MKQIVTITFNPCIDKSTTVSSLVPERKLHCTAPKFEPGGGGINVARAIHKLGGRSLAIYPYGGYSGQFLNELLQMEGIESCPIESAHHTRENLMVFEEKTGLQYRLGMPGPSLAEHEWQQCINMLQESDSEYQVVSGSLQEEMPSDLVARIAWLARRKGRKLVVDTTGLFLKLALEEGVYMIKPNLGELCTLYLEKPAKETAVRIAKEIVSRRQSQIVVVSLGQEGALLVSEDMCMQVSPPNIKRRSTVGAGDSLVAGMVLKLSQGYKVQDALRYGVACGAAATMNPGTELCHGEDSEALFGMMKRNYSDYMTIA